MGSGIWDLGVTSIVQLLVVQLFIRDEVHLSASRARIHRKQMMQMRGASEKELEAHIL